LELIVTTLALLAVVVAASIILYRRIRDAQLEYENSRNIVNNITSGFTRQVNRLQQGLSNVGNDASIAKITSTEAMKQATEAKQATLQGLEAVKSINDRMNSTETSVESIKKEIQKIASASRTRLVIPQPEVSAAIPVQQINVLQHLTDTELDVLKKIAGLNEATAPEIKVKIGLTREHTARMLKKLYDSGFVDRNTVAMPYRYQVRKEIREQILQIETPPKSILPEK